jgi:hypothetical protein
VKPAKTPKAKTAKVAAAAAVAPIVVELVNDPIENDPVSESSPKMLASGIVDVLDEIDSDVEAFEDQSFAREYVNLL